MIEIMQHSWQKSQNRGTWIGSSLRSEVLHQTNVNEHSSTSQLIHSLFFTKHISAHTLNTIYPGLKSVLCQRHAKNFRGTYVVSLFLLL